MSKKKLPKSAKKKTGKLIVTHSANFHVDDVFGTACAVLLLEKKGCTKSQIKIKRSLNPKVWAEADILLDIGRVYNPKKDRFDHHQEVSVTHANGMKYAAFGLFWKKYGKELCGSQKVAERVEEKLVVPIDAEDNGVDLYRQTIEDVRPFTIRDVVENECSRRDPSKSVTVNEEAGEFDRGFFNLIPFAKHIILQSINEAKGYIQVEKIAEKCFKESKDRRVIILSQYLGYGFSKMKEPLVMVYPDARGNWSAKAIRVTSGQFASRIYFPKTWAGLSNEDLAKVSGVSDAVFCHKGLFLAVAKSKEGAIAFVNGMFKEAGFLPVKE
ncbi:MAG: MYG1 family protein [bacterium]